jgi:hypothetical protein
MNIKELINFIDKQQSNIKEMLILKNKEYAELDNIFKVFDDIAILENRSIEEVIRTLINVKTCRLNKDFKLDTVTDLICYSYLLLAYFENRED